MTVLPAGPHFAALSSRLVTARSIAPDSPTTHQGAVARRAPCAAPAVARGDARGPRPRRGRRSPPRGSSGSSRASSTRSPTSVDSSSSWARTSSSSSSRWPGRKPAGRLSAWVSRSRLVRSEVSGVRSSWPASATSRRWRSRDADRATSIALKAVASRAISSSPSTGSGVRSSVRAISSTAVVRRRTGRRPLRATRPAAAAGADHAGQPEEQHHGPSRLSTVSCGSEGLGQDQREPSVAASAPPRPGSACRRRRWCGCSARLVPAATSSSGWPSWMSGPWSTVADVASARDEGDPDVGGAEAPRRHPVRGRASGSTLACRRPLGPVEQRLVERGLHLDPHGEEHRQGDQRDRQADGQRRQQDHPAGQRAAVVPARLRPDGAGRGRLMSP